MALERSRLDSGESLNPCPRVDIPRLPFEIFLACSGVFGLPKVVLDIFDFVSVAIGPTEKCGDKTTALFI